MNIVRNWPKQKSLKLLVNLYQSKMVENMVLADNILDGLTLNPNEGHYILKVIRGSGRCEQKMVLQYGASSNASKVKPYVVKEGYTSTYYLAKIKKQGGRNYDYLVIKKKPTVLNKKN